jgi:protein TonB
VEVVDCPKYYSKELKKYVYTKVEIEPEFPGGAAGYQRFLNRNLRYPQEQAEATVFQSQVKMKFTVDTDGKIKNLTVNDKDSTYNITPLEKEFFRVFTLMPKWVPGKCNQKTVATELNRSMVICPEKE